MVSIVASLGQKEFAQQKAKFVHQISAFGFDLSPWFAPAVFDLAVAALLHGGLRAARARLSPWPWWIAATGVAAGSVVTNAAHTGAQITAPASGVLFLIWGLHLFGQYKLIIRGRQKEDSTADEFLPTDVLFGVNRRWANRALIIAQSAMLEQGVEFRRRLGEVHMTGRAVAIRAAKIYLEVFEDQFYAQLNPADAAPAGRTNGASESDGEAKGTPRRGQGRVRWWMRSRRSRARKLAIRSAADAVDRYLGVPTLQREGLVSRNVTYTAALPDPVLGSAALPPAPPAPALPAVAPAAVAAVQPAPRRRAVAAAPGQPAPSVEGDEMDESVGLHVVDEPVTILAPGQPSGNAGMNWLPLADIPNLPVIPVDQVCECHPNDSAKWCGLSLVDHTQRIGRHLAPIFTAMPEWAKRQERIGKGEIGRILKMRGGDTIAKIGWVIDQLTRLAVAQAAGDQPVVVAAGDPPVVVAAGPSEIEAAGKDDADAA